MEALRQLVGMDIKLFHDIVQASLIASSPLCHKRFRRHWRKFSEILLLHYVSPSPIPVELIIARFGNYSTFVYMMVGCGWLGVVRRKVTQLAPKGEALVRECLRHLDREYSTLYCALEDLAASTPHNSPPTGKKSRKSKKKPPADSAN